MASTPTVGLQLRLLPDLHKAAQAAAAAADQNLTDWIRDAIREKLSRDDPNERLPDEAGR